MDIIYRSDPYAPLEYQAPISNRAALKKLSQGNVRFAAILDNLSARLAFLPAPKSIEDCSRIAQDVIARLIPTVGGASASAQLA